MSACPRCGDEKHRGRCKGGGSVVKRKKDPDVQDAPPPNEGLRSGPALSIAPGLGVEAWIENGCLQLSQGEDVVALSPTEAKVVFVQFLEWAGLATAA